MKCNYYKNLLYLFGEGELTEKEKSALDNHLMICLSCSEDAKSISLVKSNIERVSRILPDFNDEEIFTDNLINEIISKKAKGNNSSPSILNILFKVISIKPVRIALASVLVVIISSFIYETTLVVNSISNLESKTTKFSDTQVSTASIAVIEPEMFNSLNELYNLYSNKQEFAEISSNWILMSKNSFRKLLLIYDKLDNLSAGLPPEFEKEYPELSKFINETCSHEEFSIKQENEKLIHELERILNKGEKNNVKK
jgi:hypothetical protein